MVSVNNRRYWLSGVKAGSIATIVLFAVAAHPSYAEAQSFANCAAFQSSHKNVVAKSPSAKKKLLDQYPNLPVDSIAVKPRVYAANARLDSDRDGLLCEDALEQAARFAIVGDIFRDMLRESSKLRGACSLKGRSLWGSVYVTGSASQADFIVHQTTSSNVADLKVYLAPAGYLASSCGVWYLTSSQWVADFTIYMTDSSSVADFSIMTVGSSFMAGLK